MKTMISALVVAAVLVAAPAYAHDADGKWTGTLTTPMGDIPIAFEFKVDGASLSGSMSGPDGGSIAIKDGKVDGQTIAFQVNVDAGGMPLELIYKGTAAAGEIKFTMEVFGMPIDFVVKKS